MRTGLDGDIGFSIACAAKGLVNYWFLRESKRIHSSDSEGLIKEFDDFLAGLELNTAYRKQIKADPLDVDDLLYVVHASKLRSSEEAFYLRANNASSKFIGSLVELSRDNLSARDVLQIAKEIQGADVFCGTASAEIIAKIAEMKAEAEKFYSRQVANNVQSEVVIFLRENGFHLLPNHCVVEQEYDKLSSESNFFCKFTKANSGSTSVLARAVGYREALLPRTGREFETELARLMMMEDGILTHCRESDTAEKSYFFVDVKKLQDRIAAVDRRPYAPPALPPTPVVTSEGVAGGGSGVAPSVSPTGVAAPPTPTLAKASGREGK
jgi:hypothetical protein